MRKAIVVFALLLVSAAWIACEQLPSDDLFGLDGAPSFSLLPPGSCPRGFIRTFVAPGEGADQNEDCAVCRLTTRGGTVVETDNNVGGRPAPGGFCNGKKF